MPQSRVFKNGSVIYFDSENKGNSVYLFKAGSLTRTKISPATGKPELSRVQIGEFFGIKSALGNFPRDETIQVVQNATVFEFNPKEFEAVILKNVNIMFKMLQAFSNELRKIHNAIDNILHLDSGEESHDDTSRLMYIGDYYYSRKSWPQAKYVFERFLKFHPESSHVPEVKGKLDDIGRILSYQAPAAAAPAPSPVAASVPKSDASATADGISFHDPLLGETADSLADSTGKDPHSLVFNQVAAAYRSGQYPKASEMLLKLVAALKGQLPEGELYEKLFLARARLFFLTGKYNEAIAASKEFAGRYKSSKWMGHSLFVIAESYFKLGNKPNAKAVWQKITTLSKDAKLTALCQKRVNESGA